MFPTCVKHSKNKEQQYDKTDNHTIHADVC